MPQILARIREALRPGGLHHATYKGGGEEGCPRHGRYFNYLSPDEVIGMYERSGRWEILSVQDYLAAGYDPAPVPWVAITARKPREN